jgi:hypothetical protein
MQATFTPYFEAVRLLERRLTSAEETSPAATSALTQPFESRVPTARMHERTWGLSGL